MTGGSEWATAHGKAKALVAKISLLERVSLTGGAFSKTGCSGIIAPIPRLNFSGMCLSDSRNGLCTDLVNTYPAGLHVGASWNKALTRKRGAAMGGEIRRKGVNVFLGPPDWWLGPRGELSGVVETGRAFRLIRTCRAVWRRGRLRGFKVKECRLVSRYDSPTVSPFLFVEMYSAVRFQDVKMYLADMTPDGIQHFIANEQELNRRPVLGAEAVSSNDPNLDDRTMHEVYLIQKLLPAHQCLTAWQALSGWRTRWHRRTANIMCSYQRVNNSYGCANSKTLNGLLKTELGFQSDWDAQRAGVATALAGMDMAMPSPAELWGKYLVEAVKNGFVPESRVTDMAARILTACYQFGQDTKFSNPGFGMPHSMIAFWNPTNRSKAEIAKTGPSWKATCWSRIPKEPYPCDLRDRFPCSDTRPDPPGADVLAPSADEVSLDMWRYGQTSINVGQAVEGLLGNAQPAATKGTLMGGGGSGGSTAAVFVSPHDALSVHAAQDDTALYHDLSSATPDVTPSSDACLSLVFGSAWASEVIDRPGLSDTYTDTLVKKVASHASQRRPTPRGRIRRPSQHHGHSNGPSPGPRKQNSSVAVKLLYGEASPSGKLPYTLARNASVYGHLLSPDEPARRFQNFSQSDFTEGVYLDYKYFDKYNVTPRPRYEFGFGLSYTTLSVPPQDPDAVEVEVEVEVAIPASGPIVPGGQADLFDTIAQGSVRVRNTGKMAGAEVPQLYVGIPTGPAKQLRGFEKPLLRPGEAQMVEFILTWRDLSTWDTGAQKWRLQRGGYAIYVGTSSRDLPLRGSLTI
ncbi:hypothetical protein E4U28_004635 [Claviceps purpurea]|nr:hypothetical protein E4U28_004635 [Claviceps purpurea]